MEEKKKKRKWNSEHYPKGIFVRLTEEEHKEINDQAELRGLSTSRYLVACGLSKRLPIAKEKIVKTEQEREQLEMLLRQLHKIGSNLNQLAHGYNLSKLVGGKEPSILEVEEAAKLAKELLMEVKNRL